MPIFNELSNLIWNSSTGAAFTTSKPQTNATIVIKFSNKICHFWYDERSRKFIIISSCIIFLQSYLILFMKTVSYLCIFSNSLHLGIIVLFKPVGKMPNQSSLHSFEKVLCGLTMRQLITITQTCCNIEFMIFQTLPYQLFQLQIHLH